MSINTPLNIQPTASYSLAGSSLESIDTALFDFLDKDLNIFCTTNAGFKKVPVIFSVPERAYQVKAHPSLREDGMTLEYPLISIVKEGINRNPSNQGPFKSYQFPYFAYYKKGGAIDIARVVNQDKTRNFANASALNKSATDKNKNYQTFPMINDEIVYDTLSIPMPTYVEISYTVSAVTHYQQQMNEIIEVFQNFSSIPSVFPIKNERNTYETFMSPDFSFENNSSGLDVNQRVFKTNISFTVLGHLIGEGKNQDTPIIVKRESAAKVQIQRERVVLGDEVPFHVNQKPKYRP